MIFPRCLNLLRRNYGLKIISRNYSICNLLKDPKVGDQIEVKGWIANIRKQKEYIFIDVNDGSTSKRLQVIAPTQLNIDAKELSTGSSIIIQGSLVLSPKGNLELFAKEIKLVTNCSTENGYPFAPRKQYTPEYFRQYFHLRSKTNKFSSLLRVRSAASFAFHSAFQDDGFVNINTPILTSNDCEGAGEAFKVIPDDQSLLKSMAGTKTNTDEVFFNNKSYLTVSGQLHLEAVANGLGRVYTFGPTFRAENSKSRFHLAEFYMIEAEIAFLEEIESLLRPVERLIKKVTRNLLENNLSDIHVCQDSNKDELDWTEKEFQIVTYDEALKIIEDNALQFEGSSNIQKGLKKEHEMFLVKHLGNIPTFIINWPKSDKPFYMKESEIDSSKVLAFDLLAPGVGEIVGGSLRENNLTKLKERLPHGSKLDWYVDLRKFGGVPTGGFGLGFERYLQAILKIDNIKDTIPFPRWPHNCLM